MPNVTNYERRAELSEASGNVSEPAPPPEYPPGAPTSSETSREATETPAEPAAPAQAARAAFRQAREGWLAGHRELEAARQTWHEAQANVWAIQGREPEAGQAKQALERVRELEAAEHQLTGRVNAARRAAIEAGVPPEELQ
ncbi:MAG TPA: hypothetical protein VFU43_25265 [Streptosporangiaceae bacterium]|nr:hypothetical protein [Streptosporangiaceae bacterium]